MASFDEMMNKEIARRDAALARMTSNLSATTSMVTTQIEKTKTDIFGRLEKTKNDMFGRFQQTRNEVTSRFEQTKSDVVQKVEELKSKLNPEHVVREYPWPSVAVALVAGIAAVPLIRSYLTPAPMPQTQIVSANPNQKIVVEVVGAKPAASVSNLPWRQILEAASAGIPAIAIYLKKFFYRQSEEYDGGRENETTESGVAGENPEVHDPAVKPYPKTISRRYGSPPAAQ